jgi:hypothetical protein
MSGTMIAYQSCRQSPNWLIVLLSGRWSSARGARSVASLRAPALWRFRYGRDSGGRRA